MQNFQNHSPRNLYNGPSNTFSFPLSSYNNRFNTDKISQPHYQSIVSNLLQKNNQLQDRLNQQKTKNFNLIELKRRMQQDLKKMQFQFDRISTHQNLYEKQQSIKNYQLLNQNNKLTAQLNTYYQENKQLRQQLRKYHKQVQQLTHQAETLKKQNIYLLKQIEDFKYKSNDNPEITKQPYYNYIPESRSQNSKESYISPNKIQMKTQSNPSTHLPKSYVFNTKQFSSHSPLTKINQEKQYINHHDTDISHRSFANPVIRNLSMPKQQIMDQNKKYKSQHNQYFSDRKPELINHNIGHKQPRNQINNENVYYEEQTDRATKISVQNKVSGLREDVVKLLLTKTYHRSISEAQNEKVNALKKFIHQVSKTHQGLLQMSSNYLQARQGLIEVCPNTRYKWQDNIPSNCTENDRQIYTLYKNVRQKSKKQKNLGGQFLALFRILTILNKIDVENIDKGLLSDIQHSAVKYIYKITLDIQNERQNIQKLLV